MPSNLLTESTLQNGNDNISNYIQSYLGITANEIGIYLFSTGSHIQTIVNLLHKAGYVFPQPKPPMYNLDVENAVIDFQEDNEIKVTGTINDKTLRLLVKKAEEKSSDTIISSDDNEENDETEELANPHYDSFFSNSNTKDVRKNNQDIIITLGNNIVTKTIHNVYMRGVSTEYDTSGNPISETYEFIAQDLTESDELKDKYKYE